MSLFCLLLLHVHKRLIITAKNCNTMIIIITYSFYRSSGEKGQPTAATPSPVGPSNALKSLSVSELCSIVSSLFEECLEYDLQSYTVECPTIASKKLGKQVMRISNNSLLLVLHDYNVHVNHYVYSRCTHTSTSLSIYIVSLFYFSLLFMVCM